MKRILKYLFRFIIALVVIVNAIILISGRTYIYKGIVYTYFQGKTGPGITDQDLFESNIIRNDLPQAWRLHSAYNERTISLENSQRLADVRTTSLLIVHQDSLLFEKYWGEIESNTITNSFSIAKSIVGVLIGIAIEEGHIKNLDQPVKDFLPSFAEGGKEVVTIRHCLTMASGLDWHESGGNPFSDNAEGYYGTDLRAQVEDLELTATPGKEFIYQGGNTLILSFVLKAATGKSVAELAEEKLWEPLGAESNALWNLDKEGGDEKAFCCFYATAKDFARLGRLYLNDGVWNGRQIVPAKYVELTTKPAALTAQGKPNERYGYHWWTENYKGLDLYYARGIYGQYIVVIPEKELVVFRAGHLRSVRNDKGHPTDIYVYIDTALEIIQS